MAKSNGRGVIRYKSYSFVDKDPLMLLAISKFRQIGMRHSALVAATGGSKAMYGWIHRDTRRPQAATLIAHLRAMGVKSIDIGDNKPEIK
jgi:hypothetical protein